MNLAILTEAFFYYRLMYRRLMCRSIRNFNIPPGIPRAFYYFLCPGVGNLTRKAFPGVGNLTFAWGVGKLNRKCQASNCIFFVWRLTHSFAGMEKYKGKDLAFVTELFTKRDFERSVVFLKVCMNTRVCLLLACFIRCWSRCRLKSSRFTERKIVDVCRAFKNSHWTVKEKKTL